MTFGCGEETIDNPLGESFDEKAKTEKAAPISSIYYPITAGSRWVYRNPDGSQWVRKVIETNKNVSNPHPFSSESPMVVFDKGLGLTNTSYEVKQNKFILSVKDNEINDTVWQTILESGGETPDWSLHRTSVDGVWRTTKSSEDILTFLHKYDTEVTWHNDVELIQFPLDLLHRWTAISIKLRGHDTNAPFLHTHTFEADTRISAHASYAGFLEKSLGQFHDCLKIQYEAELSAVITKLFDPGSVGKLDLKDNREKLVTSLEDEINKEFATLLMKLMPRLHLQTMWLAPGVGPVKIETPDGIAELIDYEIKAVASGQ